MLAKTLISYVQARRDALAGNPSAFNHFGFKTLSGEEFGWGDPGTNPDYSDIRAELTGAEIDILYSGRDGSHHPLRGDVYVPPDKFFGLFLSGADYYGVPHGHDEEVWMAMRGRVPEVFGSVVQHDKVAGFFNQNLASEQKKALGKIDKIARRSGKTDDVLWIDARPRDGSQDRTILDNLDVGLWLDGKRQGRETLLDADVTQICPQLLQATISDSLTGIIQGTQQQRLLLVD